APWVVRCRGPGEPGAACQTPWVRRDIQPRINAAGGMCAISMAVRNGMGIASLRSQMTGTDASPGPPLRLSCQLVCTFSGVHIGIVIPAFNAASWIGDAMVSVLAQTHRDWSLVVVDDGSTDGTSAV